MKLPETLITEDGYPTDDWLEFIKNYRPTQELPIMEFVTLLRRSWWNEERQFVVHPKRKNITKLELHTGGWSGNESIMYAIRSNPYLINMYMEYVQWKRGGHFYFEIRRNL